MLRKWQCEKCSKHFSSSSSLSRHCKRCLIDAPRPTRRKACEECCNSKSRCDERRPVCGRCKLKRIQCHYVVPPRSAGDSDGSPTADDVGANTLMTPPVDFAPFLDYSQTGTPGSTSHITIDTHPTVRHVMRYIIRVFMTYPRMFGHGQPPPIIHHTQLKGEVPRSLNQCMAVLSGLDSPESASTLESSVKYEAYALLAKHETYNEVELLPTLQAYILYSIFLLFPTKERNTRTHTQNLNIIMGLQDMSLALMKSGLLLKAETQSIVPSWEAWIAVAAKRRAIQASHTLMWAWSLQHKYPPFGCREVAFMPTPSPKVLWQARDDEDWKGHYNKWLEYWCDGGPHRLEELMLVKPGIEIDERTQRWLEEADEFGLLLMSQVNAID